MLVLYNTTVEENHNSLPSTTNSKVRVSLLPSSSTASYTSQCTPSLNDVGLVVVVYEMESMLMKVASILPEISSTAYEIN